MKRILYCVFSAFILLGMASCKDFLEVKPKGVILPEKLTDYESLLNSVTMMQSFPSALLYNTDDYYVDYSPIERSIAANMYFWRPEADVNDQLSPAIWGQLYRVIYNANVIIKNAMKTKGESEQRKKEVLAEALLVRSDAYFSLLTAFSKAYDPATAATDAGMPLITSNDVTEAAPPRSRLKATMDTVLNNALQAANDLPLNNINRYRGTKAAAHGFLARVYLYIGDYANAEKYTSLALQASHKLIDYNTIANKNGIPVSDLNPEILWQRACEEFILPGQMLYSDNLKAQFDVADPLQSNDLRYVYLTTTNSKGVSRNSPPGRTNFGVTFPELYLNVAELAARADNPAKAMEWVNKLRIMRIKKAAYQPLTAVDKETALTNVFAERRRELVFAGVRWMDMKRLDKEGRMPEVQRINKKTGEVLGTLKPHSKAYTLQIPARVRMFNPNMELN
uniref:RagB/SusD family nutrient uptake outer membrane protein n=1 Tax=Pedobacter schmidteae TaxID=2201271 RepID=UPI0013CE4EAB|nr:RagB/SusD family nutrient uptake outer membrane protein [Pedobacter schmidteae]